jgi:DNA-directed RNA polymerase subunit M/transcription elongation factor TFIIS
MSNENDFCPNCKSLLVPKKDGLVCTNCDFIRSYHEHEKLENDKIKNGFCVKFSEIQNTPKMSDREKFVYIFTSLTLNPVVMSLSQKRKDEVLAKLKDKFCPTLTLADWYVLFHECEKMRSDLVNAVSDILTVEEMLNIHADFTKLVGDHNYGKISELVEKIGKKIR